MVQNYEQLARLSANLTVTAERQGFGYDWAKAGRIDSPKSVLSINHPIGTSLRGRVLRNG